MPSLRLRSKSKAAAEPAEKEVPAQEPSSSSSSRSVPRRTTRSSQQPVAEAPPAEAPRRRVRKVVDQEQNLTLNISPGTARIIKEKRPVINLQRCVTRSSAGRVTQGNADMEADQPPDNVQESADVQVHQVEQVPEPQANRKRPGGRKKKRLRPLDPEEEPVPELLPGNLLLPSVDDFPEEDDSSMVKLQKLRDLRATVTGIFGLIFNQVQQDIDNTKPCFDSVERVYEFFDIRVGARWSNENRINFGNKYRRVCVTSLWGFGAVVWKQNVGTKGANHNVFAQRAAKFIEYCLIHLGWKFDRRRGKGEPLRELKHPDYNPACYHALKCFAKYHCDLNALSRQNQLSLLNKFMENVELTQSWVEDVFEIVGKQVMVRVKDKSSTCRVLALKILSYFVLLSDEEWGMCQKELKFYTRYDPFLEVRRLGTRILGEKTRIKLRFFFDQAFDRQESVRVEAFRAMTVEAAEENREPELVRDMQDLAKDKLIKAIVWGTMHSGVKCHNIVKSEILPKWIEKCCGNSLAKFLENLDAYQHMKAVVKILDLMLTTKDQERFVESVDLSFIPLLKQNVLDKNYTQASIESFVAWLGLCKAAEVVESIRGRVVPGADEMLALVEALHICVFNEHEAAKATDRSEDISPVYCLVLALEIAKSVAWEEGNRLEFVKFLRLVLLDPLLDERIIVIQGVNVLHASVKEDEFEETMMSIFQDVFDSQAVFNRTTESGIAEVNRGGSPTRDDSANMSIPDVNIRVESDNVSVEAPAPAPVPPPPKTAYELTKMRERLCDLKMQRIKLDRQKDDLIQRKMFIDAVPVNQQISEIQMKEAQLGHEIQESEDYAKGVVEERKRAEEMRRIEARAREEVEMLSRKSVVEQVREEEEMQQQDEVDDQQEEVESAGREEARGIISSIEEGLAKGIIMVNAFLDLCPKMGPFVRNIYEGYVAGFMAQEKDVHLKVSVLQFLTRIGMIEKRQSRKVFCFMIKILTSRLEVELRNVAFQSLVDLVVSYEYSDFCMTQTELLEGDDLHPYKSDMSAYLKEHLPDEKVEYPDATPEIIEKLTLKLVTKRFPPSSDSLTAQETNILHLTKNLGLLKLLVRGRLRDPVIISKVLTLWVNHDYAGTPVLRDLEQVLKLYGTFDWWGTGAEGIVDEIQGEITDDEFQVNHMMRVLGVAVGEGVVSLVQERVREGSAGKDVEDEIFKFIAYFLSYIDGRDQPLIRTISSTILSPIQSNTSRSYNWSLVRCATKVPLTSPVSASAIVRQIHEIFVQMKEHPITPSVQLLRKELIAFIAKLKRVFGDEIATIRDGDGKERQVGTELFADDDEDEEDENVEEEEEEAVGAVAAFSEDEEI